MLRLKITPLWPWCLSAYLASEFDKLIGSYLAKALLRKLPKSDPTHASLFQSRNDHCQLGRHAKCHLIFFGLTFDRQSQPTSTVRQGSQEHEAPLSNHQVGLRELWPPLGFSCDYPYPGFVQTLRHGRWIPGRRDKPRGWHPRLRARGKHKAGISSSLFLSVPGQAVVQEARGGQIRENALHLADNNINFR